MSSNTNAVRTQQGASTRTRNIAFTGMFAAIAAVLMFLEFPLPFAPSFYELDFSEVPVLIGTFALGPVSGMVIELIKILVKTVIKGTHTAGVGEIANFVIGCSLCVPAGLIYKMRKTRKSAVIGMIAGTLTMTVVGCLVNVFVLLPAYAAAFQMPMDALVAMGTAVNSSVTGLASFALLCVAPFNLFKGAVVSVLTLLLYKRISRLIKGV